VRAGIGYIVGLVVILVGILGVLRVVPVFPPPPATSGCAWYDVVCQFRSGVQNAYNSALYGVARLVAALFVLVVAFLLLVLPLGPLGPRALTAIGLGLIALSLGMS